MIDIKQYPKVQQQYKEYVLQQLGNVGQLVDAEVLKAFPIDNMVDSSLAVSDNLFKFLDSKNLIVTVWRPTGTAWKFRVEDTFPVEGNAVDRKEAELKGFTQAIERLEKRQ